MLQQVNLYKLLPIQSRFHLTQKVILLTYGIFLSLLLLIYGFGWWQKKQAIHEDMQLNNQVNALQQRLASLTKQYPITDALALDNILQQLKHQYSVKIKLLNLLTVNTKFSTYLLGLANVDMPGVWLTEILFNNMDQRIDLKGFALQAALVEKMLVQLSTQAAFSNLRFEIQNMTERPLPLSFEVSTQRKSLE